MNLGQARDLVRIFISQTDTTNTDFTDAELNGFINVGIRFLGALVKHPRDMIEIQAEAGKSSYQLPADAVIIRTAYFGDVSAQGDVRPLFVMTEEALKEQVPSWLSQDTVDYGRPQRIILLDQNTILIIPTPGSDEAASGKKIRLGYVYQPSELSTDISVIDLPIVYHDFVPEYANYLCCMGKLKEYEKGVSILETVINKAKKLENLVIKDTEAGFGFFWGGGFNPNID